MSKSKYIKEIIITHKEIVKRSKEIGELINKDYKDSKNLIIVGLLKGSLPFMMELIKHIDVEHKQDFMTVSSYHGTLKRGSIKLIMDLKNDIMDADILIVEDIVDSGHTISKVKKLLETREAKSIRIVTLLNKQAGRQVECIPDIVGFEIEDEFVAGFGLDVKEKLRNLPYIGIFNEELFEEL